MPTAGFEQKRARLKAAYQTLLAEHSLAGHSMPERTARNNFNAMYVAGWFSPASKEQAWDTFSKSRVASRERPYDHLLDWLSNEVEEAIRVRGGVLINPVYARPWPIG